MNRPIILDNAINRSTDDDKKIFKYDYNKDLNVVKVKNCWTTFINIDDYLNELYTKTEVDRERDDEDNINYN